MPSSTEVLNETRLEPSSPSYRDPMFLGNRLEEHRAYLKMLAKSKIHGAIRSKIDPSDLVQETCIEAVRQIKHFRGRSSGEFAAWLRSILADRIAKTMRRYLGTMQRNVKLEFQLQKELDDASGNLETFLSPSQVSPSEMAEWNETVLLLAKALEQLPEEYQRVVLLRNLEGLSFREVADAMGRSVDSVEKLWVRALMKLKHVMRETNEGT